MRRPASARQAAGGRRDEEAHQPARRRRERRARRHRASPPRPATGVRRPRLIARADAPVKARWRSSPAAVRARAHARRLRRPRHARRRLPGTGVHLADARPDAGRHPGRRRRRRRPLIVKNYTGDVMHFEMAAELAADEGIAVESVVIDDDVAVPRQPAHRGAARRGRHHPGREDLRRRCRAGPTAGRRHCTLPRGERRRRSMGVALTRAPCRWSVSPPSRWATTRSSSGSAFTASPAASGCRWPPRAEVVEALTAAIVDDLPFVPRRPCAGLRRRSGATPLMELYIVYNELHALLEARGIASRAT